MTFMLKQSKRGRSRGITGHIVHFFLTAMVFRDFFDNILLLYALLDANFLRLL